MDNDDYEGAILAGYHAKTEEEIRQEELNEEFNRHIDLCPRCDYEHGAFCERAEAMMNVTWKNPAKNLSFENQLKQICDQFNRTYGQNFMPILDPATPDEYVILGHSSTFGNSGLARSTAEYVKKILGKAKIKATIEPAGDGYQTVRCKAPG
jgi:hypothetical protein